MQDVYIEIPSMTRKQDVSLLNRQHKKCLDRKSLKLNRCQPVEQQLFRISKSLIVQTMDTPSECLGFLGHE